MAAFAAALSLPATSLCGQSERSPLSLLLEGSWQITLRVDSFSRHRAARSSKPARPLGTIARGTIIFSRQVGQDSVTAESDIDFAPIGGPPCFWRAQAVLPVRAQGDSIQIDFTPHVSDCGLYAWAKVEGDSVVGTWIEPGMGFTATRGSLVMTRTR